ncbi:MAG: hypothetical protein ACKESB_02515 [Candidatus Hodgkinia cicadicola]
MEGITTQRSGLGMWVYDFVYGGRRRELTKKVLLRRFGYVFRNESWF